jgi:thiol-disulfide isomerase/thioredoxin
LKIRGIRGLDRKLQNGTPLVDILSRTGKEGLPLSDGEMVEDIRTLQGKPVPSVTFRSVLPKEGEEFPLPGGLKKPTLIVFWIATCPHCQKEIPRIVEFWRMRKKELDIVTVTRVYPEEIRKITDRYLKERSLQDLPVYEGTEELFQKFRVEGVPAWAMVSPSGRVVQAFVGEDPDLFYHLNEALQKAGK